MTPSRIVIATIVLTACSKSQPASALVDTHPLTISFRGQTIARLFADGRTESVGPNAPGERLLPGPTIHADGTMVMTKGAVTARLDDKGDIYVREQLFGHIAGEELTFAGSTKPWDVRARGNLIEFSEHDNSQIDGEVTPSMRHTALVMAAAFYIDGALASH